MIRKVIESVQELDDLLEDSVVLCLGNVEGRARSYQKASDTGEWSSGHKNYELPSADLFRMYETIFLLWKSSQFLTPTTQMQDLGSLTLGKLAEHDVPHHFRDAVEAKEKAEEVRLPELVPVQPEPEPPAELGEAYTVGHVKKWVGSFKLHNVDIMLGDVGSLYHGLGLPRDSMVIQFWCEGERFDPWRYVLSEDELYYDTGTQRERAEADLPLLDVSHYDKEVRVVIIG